MSDIKTFKITKTRPGNLLFILHPISNLQMSKEIYLTDRSPSQFVPLDWALGVFLDDGVYKLYKKGHFTFSDNDAVVKAAYEAGVYFDETLDFTPAVTDNSDKVLEVLKSGNRKNIESAIKLYGDDVVKAVAFANTNNLTVNVVRMLEDLFKVQLTLDGE